MYNLKDDHNPKTIEIWEGDYDIYEEYKELYDDGLLDIYDGDNPAMDYFDYCVWVPKNTHIVGKGIVRLKWMPDPSTDDITAVQCRCISPLNVAATATIENVEVYCKNGRYCLHNDGLGKIEFTGATQLYKNVRFYKYANDVDENNVPYGFSQTTGFGIDRSMHHVYENCLFFNEAGGRAFYGHSRNSVGGILLTEARNSDITLVNCVCVTNGSICVKFGNSSNSALHIRTMLNNCYFSGLITAIDESGTSSYPNAFDMSLLNCGDVTMHIGYAQNQYLPKAYNTNLQLT